LNLKVNLSGIYLNTSFKHTVEDLDDLKVASHRISEVEHLIKEQEWKLYDCCKRKLKCIKAITDTNGSENIVNIKIHTSNESLAMYQEDVPLRELTTVTPDDKPRRSSRIRASRSCF
jgi:hypothetical protein